VSRVRIRFFAALFVLTAASFAEVSSVRAQDAQLRSTECQNRNALGTSRVMEVGTSGGLDVGLKTYPRTLPLADKEVVLTFDDGPMPASTEKVLAALRAECVRATFFVVGRNATDHPALVRREIADGHTVGHHSWSHPGTTLRGISEAAAQAEILRGISAVQEAAGGKPYTDGKPTVPFFRFPGFADTAALNSWLQTRDIAVFGTDLWASDWNPMSAAAELRLVMQRLDHAGRGIILFHDTRAQTAEMLPAFLRELKARGYRVVHMVPGSGKSAVAPAPAGWTSETEAILTHVMPRLLRANGTPAKHGM
jgi:peptidoglycan/xylan/chitin deacetylase (PgdA/CDA1 family)